MPTRFAVVALIILALWPLPAIGSPFAGTEVSSAIIDKVFDKLMVQSDEWFHNGEYLRSVQAFRMRIAYDPADLESYFLAAWLLWSSGDDSGAQSMYAASVRAVPDSFMPYMEIGLHWSNRGDDRKAALWLFHACARGAPVEAYKQLAHSYRKLGLLREALGVMQMARKMDPADPSIPRNILWIQEMLRSKPGQVPGATQ